MSQKGYKMRLKGEVAIKSLADQVSSNEKSNNDLYSERRAYLLHEE
jgi:hypothetical protein